MKTVTAVLIASISMAAAGDMFPEVNLPTDPEWWEENGDSQPGFESIYDGRNPDGPDKGEFPQAVDVTMHADCDEVRQAI